MSGYVCAGFETLATIIDNFILNKKGGFKDHFTREDISNFFDRSVNKFLHSYGQNFKGKKSYIKYNESEGNLLKKCRDTKLFDKSKYICDSGGFQISCGILNKKETALLSSMYYTFLQDYVDHYDNAFILDVPPGPGCQIFTDFEDVYRQNMDSYTMAASMPDNVRDKIIYVHHFRTPKLWDIYTKILDEDNLFSKFKYHGTGGIVANMSSDIAIPCIIYVLPLVPLINRAIKSGRDYLNFHILGGASYRDVLFYALFKECVKKKHGIDLNITFDSSGIFKGLMVGRFMSIFDEKNMKISKLDLRTECLNLRFNEDQKVIDVFRTVIGEFCDRFGFKNEPIDKIYDDATGTFYDFIRTYSMLYTLNTYSDLENALSKLAPHLCSVYESGDVEEFSSQVEFITRSMNDGKITRKQIAKSYSLAKSLDILSNLDEDFC